jgi:hypothetical protein
MSVRDVRDSINDATPEEWDRLSKTDPVNSPSHYKHSGDIECIDAIRAMLGREGLMHSCEANIIKYLWRWRYKGGVESLRKARWYLEKLIKEETHVE